MLNVTEGNSSGVWLLDETGRQAGGVRTRLLSTEYAQDTSREMKAFWLIKLMRW